MIVTNTIRAKTELRELRIGGLRVWFTSNLVGRDLGCADHVLAYRSHLYRVTSLIRNSPPLLGPP